MTITNTLEQREVSMNDTGDGDIIYDVAYFNSKDYLDFEMLVHEISNPEHDQVVISELAVFQVAKQFFVGELVAQYNKDLDKWLISPYKTITEGTYSEEKAREELVDIKNYEQGITQESVQDLPSQPDPLIHNY
jgi:hypothetical protein